MRPVQAARNPVLTDWLANRVSAGFGSPAEDIGAKRVDLNRILAIEEEDTYFMRVEGQSMENYGIYDKDILCIKKGRDVHSGNIVVVSLDNEFLVKCYDTTKGRLVLKAGNPKYPDIEPKELETVRFWGVVSATIKLFPR